MVSAANIPNAASRPGSTGRRLRGRLPGARGKEGGTGAALVDAYAVGFVARPIGGIVIGHFGDRIGRKSMLILTLTVTGIATSLIGRLPTYEQMVASETRDRLMD